jgi:hypothetical protein
MDRRIIKAITNNAFKLTGETRKEKYEIEFSERFMEYLEEDGIEVENPVFVSVTMHVCGTCNGKGTIVHPSIDGNGLTREDFDNDPQFEEDYFDGVYDIRCTECEGLRVVAEPNFNSEIAKIYSKFLADEDYAERERYWEMKMGY